MSSFKKFFLFYVLILATLFTGCGGGGGSTTPTTTPDFDFTSTATQTLTEVTPEFNGTPKLKTTTSTIDSTIADDLKDISFSNNVGTITFEVDTGESFSHNVGDVLVLNSDQMSSNDSYPLQKITNVTENGNIYTVTTAYASLDEVIEECDFAFTQEVTASDLDAFGAQFAPGISVKKSPIVMSDTIKFGIEKELYSGSNVTVKAVGTTDMKLKFGYNIKINKDYGLNYFRMAVKASQTSKIGFTANGTCNFTKTINYGNAVNTKVKFTIPAAIPIPVWIDVKIPIISEANISLSATAETMVTRSDSGMVGVLYDATDPGNWNLLDDYQKNYSFDPFKVKASADATFMIGPKLESNVYSITGGPWVSFYGGLVFNSVASPSYPTGFEYQLKAALSSKAGVDISLLGKNIAKKDFTIFDPNTTSANFKFGDGPDLVGLATDTNEIRVLKGNSYSLSQLKYTASFVGGDEEIDLTDQRLTFTTNGGALNRTSDNCEFTAPNTAGDYEITSKYTYKNQFQEGDDIEKTCKIYVKVVEPKTLSSISLSSSAQNVNINDTFDLSTISVTANYTDNTNATQTEVSWSVKSGNGSVLGKTFTAPSAAGTTVLTCTYVETVNSENISKTADLTLTIVDNTNSGGSTGDDSGDVSSITAADSGTGYATFKSSNITLSAGSSKKFKVTVPAGNSILILGSASDDASGATGSVYTYIKYGSEASSSNNDYADNVGSEVGSGTSYVNPTAGDYYVTIVAKTDISNFFVKAQYFALPTYTLTNHFNLTAEGTYHNITAAEILIYELSNEEVSAHNSTNGAYTDIYFNNVNSGGVFWSMNPSGLPGYDPSWKSADEAAGSSSDSQIFINTPTTLEGMKKIYIYVDDEALYGGAKVIGETTSY